VFILILYSKTVDNSNESHSKVVDGIMKINYRLGYNITRFQTTL